jgi:hypothetical protein
LWALLTVHVNDVVLLPPFSSIPWLKYSSDGVAAAVTNYQKKFSEKRKFQNISFERKSKKCIAIIPKEIEQVGCMQMVLIYL